MAGRARRHPAAADELICTEAEAAALQALRVATGETGGGMERHTVRQYLIAERLADTRAIPYGRELLLCASFLHPCCSTLGTDPSVGGPHEVLLSELGATFRACRVCGRS